MKRIVINQEEFEKIRNDRAGDFSECCPEFNEHTPYPIDICKAIPDDTILLGYFTSLFDRAIHAKRKNVMGWQYFYCPDMINANCRVFKVLK